MITVLVDCDRIERSQTIDETRLMNNLRSPSTISAFVRVGRLNDPWGIEEGGGGIDRR